MLVSRFAQFMPISVLTALTIIDDDTIDFVINDGNFEEYGVCECKELLKVVLKMPPILPSGINLNDQMAHKYMSKINETTKRAIWSGMRPEWFVGAGKTPSEKSDKKASMVEFHEEESGPWMQSLK